MRLYPTLLVFAAFANAATPVDSYVQQVQSLVAKHSAAVTRLNAAVNATASVLVSGGGLHLFGDQSWWSENYGRSGGLVDNDIFSTLDKIHSGDACWIEYSSASYQSIVGLGNIFQQRGCVVIAFGPQPPSSIGPVPFTYWVDSLTSWIDPDDLTLLGNVLSTWSLTGELAAATARQNKTLTFRQSILMPNGDVRNALLEGQMFHSGAPQMSSNMQAGALSTAYLTYVGALVNRIAQTQVSNIVTIGQKMGRLALAGTPTVLLANSHLVDFIASNGSLYFQYLSDASKLSGTLGNGGYLVDLAYFGVDSPTWQTVRSVGATAAWINGQPTNQPDFSSYGDVSINEQWDFGDATVAAPGYDVQILPASGVAQLFIYDLLLQAAAAGSGTTPFSVSITSPSANATVSGASVPVAISTAGSVTSAQLKIDGANSGSPATSAPFNLNFDSTALANGSHVLSVIISDAASHAAVSTGVTFNVSNNVVTGNSNSFVTGSNPGASRNNFGGWVGFQFTVGSVPLNVTMLGRMVLAGNSTVHNVKLVRASDSVDVPGGSAAVNTSGAIVGQFAYSTLQSAVILQANTSYYLLSFETVDGDRWYDYGPVSTTNVASVNGPAYWDGTRYNMLNAAGNAWVPVDFKYSTAPASLSVTITSPSSGTILSGKNVQISVSAAGSVASVQLKVNGQATGAASTKAPYTLALDTTLLTDGAYSLSAIASDGNGQSASSSNVDVTVNNSAVGNSSSFVTAQTPGAVRNNFSGLVGMAFKTGAAPITVTSLGRLFLTGNTGTHTLKLVQAINGADVPGGLVQVSMIGGTLNRYSFGILSGSVTLQANTAYYVVSQESAGGDQWFDYGQVTSTSVANVTGPVYADGNGNWNTITAFPGNSYVPVNFTYR